jgi:hypothetical protein
VPTRARAGSWCLVGGPTGACALLPRHQAFAAARPRVARRGSPRRSPRATPGRRSTAPIISSAARSMTQVDDGQPVTARTKPCPEQRLRFGSATRTSAQSPYIGGTSRLYLGLPRVPTERHANDLAPPRPWPPR